MHKNTVKQAFAHLQQLVQLGAAYEQALQDTIVAYALDKEAVNMVKGCWDLNGIHKELGIAPAY